MKKKINDVKEINEVNELEEEKEGVEIEEKDSRVKIEEQINKDLDELEKYSFDDERRKCIVREITELSAALKDYIHQEADQYNKEQEFELKKKQQKTDKFRNIVNGVFGGATVVMYALSLVGEAKGFIAPRMTNLLPKPQVKM